MSQVCTDILELTKTIESKLNAGDYDGLVNISQRRAMLLRTLSKLKSDGESPSVSALNDLRAAQELGDVILQKAELAKNELTANFIDAKQQLQVAKAYNTLFTEQDSYIDKKI